jgi:hypothetical protein
LDPNPQILLDELIKESRVGLPVERVDISCCKAVSKGDEERRHTTHLRERRSLLSLST